MTDIEALLSVDNGHTPPGTVAIFLDDGTRGFRWGYAITAMMAGLGAVVVAIAGCGRAPTALLLLLAGTLAVRAMPTLPQDENRDPKRQVLVLTALGVIVRDGAGLRRWLFEDLSDVVAGMNDSQPFLNLIDKNGKRHIVQCPAYRRGLRLRHMISARLQVRHPSSV